VCDAESEETHNDISSPKVPRSCSCIRCVSELDSVKRSLSAPSEFQLRRRLSDRSIRTRGRKVSKTDERIVRRKRRRIGSRFTIARDSVDDCLDKERRLGKTDGKSRSRVPIRFLCISRSRVRFSYSTHKGCGTPCR